MTQIEKELHMQQSISLFLERGVIERTYYLCGCFWEDVSSDLTLLIKDTLT